MATDLISSTATSMGLHKTKVLQQYSHLHIMAVEDLILHMHQVTTLDILMILVTLDISIHQAAILMICNLMATMFGRASPFLSQSQDTSKPLAQIG